MKAIKKPTQTAIAKALGVDPAIVSRDKRRGMPVHSIEAALEWRDANLRVRWNPDADASAVERSVQGERAAERAGAMLQAAGELLQTGGDIAPMVPALRQCMAAVPFAQRSRVLFPFDVMDHLTADVGTVMDQGDPDGLIYGALYAGKGEDGEPVNMGAFWYAVAAGEIRVRRPTG